MGAKSDSDPDAGVPDTNCASWRAILKEAGETSMKDPVGRLWNRGEERPRRVEAAVGAGERTRRRRGIICELALALVAVVWVEVEVMGEEEWSVSIMTSCHPVSFF